MKKIEVMLDRAANNLSIIAADDTDGREVETTLSLEQAWTLVADLNASIAKLMPSIATGGLISPRNVAKAKKEPVIKRGGDVFQRHFNIDARGASNPEQVREAVLHAIDSKRYQNTAY